QQGSGPRCTVELGWPASTGRVGTSAADPQIPSGGEFVQVVSGDVWVERKPLRNSGGCHPRWRLSCEQVYLPAGRVAEGGRDSGNYCGELVAGRHHRRQLTNLGIRPSYRDAIASIPSVLPRRVLEKISFTRVLQKASSMIGMPVSESQVFDALQPVLDPELGVSIVELGMVKAVRIDGGQVVVTVALTVAGCPLRHEIDRRVRDVLQPLQGIEKVAVELTVMSARELAEVQARVGARKPEAWSQGDARRLGHEDGRVNQFMDIASRTRVVGISSGKGGVGKSSVTVNLAVTLAEAGHSVGLLDADVYGFSVPAMLGVKADPATSNGRVIPPVAFGVRTMSMGFFVDEDQPVIWRGPMLHKALEQFLADVDWGAPDYLLVDMPPGTGDVALSMAQYLPASEVYVVTTPQPTAKRVAQRTAYMARKLNLPLRGVIENMSWFIAPDGTRYEIFGQGGGARLAEELAVPLLGQIPLVQALREGSDEGVPVVVSEPLSEAAGAFRSIASKIAALGQARVFREELRVT
ncbi:MAG TPA: P-loop NTPase, partial [Acidimicrobiales bacterium]|nr:P-loop NTPase [Acidimicrobiales bacterium]